MKWIQAMWEQLCAAVSSCRRAPGALMEWIKAIRAGFRWILGKLGKLRRRWILVLVIVVATALWMWIRV